MNSEIIPKSTLRQKQWEACKTRVGAGLGEISAFALRKAKDIIADIRTIKERELWREGGYASFGEFVDRMIGISLRQVYRLLNADDEMRNLLEIRESRMTLCHNGDESGTPQPMEEKQPEKSLNDPPKQEKKARKTKPEPVDATFSESPSAPLRTSLPTIDHESIANQAIDAAARKTDLVDVERHAFITGFIAGYEKALGIGIVKDACRCQSKPMDIPEPEPATAVACPCMRNGVPCGEMLSPEGLAFLISEGLVDPEPIENTL